MLFIPALFAVATADPSALEFNFRRSSPKVAKHDGVLSAWINNDRGTGLVIDVGIGSPSESLELNLDTFRQGLFLCDFHPDNSSTYTSKGTLHDDFNSTLSQDTLTIGDHEIDDIEFAYSDFGSLPLGHVAPAPYLGIGLPNESDPYYHLSLPVQLKNQGLISVAAYSLYLNYFVEGNILFGSIDSARLASDLHKFPIVDDYNGDRSLSIALDGLYLYDTDGTHQKVADSSLSLSLNMKEKYSVLPWEMLEPLYAAFGVKCPDDYAKVDCGSLKYAGGVGLSFSGVEYDFSFHDVAVELGVLKAYDPYGDPDEYSDWCIPGFAVMDYYRPVPFLGLNFLWLLYVVVDLENEEIGLAKGQNILFSATSSSYLEMSTGIPAPRAPGYRSEEPLQIMQPHSVTFGYSAPATHSPKSSSCSAKSSQMIKYSSGSPSDFYTDVHTTIGKGLASGVVSIHDSYDENSTAASSEKSSSNVSASTTGRRADTSGGNESASATADRTTTSDTSRISESSKKTTSSAPSAKSTSARSPSSSSASKSKDAAPKQAVSAGLATFGLLGVLALI